jgi:hypothetical protein
MSNAISKVTERERNKKQNPWILNIERNSKRNLWILSIKGKSNISAY